MRWRRKAGSLIPHGPLWFIKHADIFRTIRCTLFITPLWSFTKPCLLGSTLFTGTCYLPADSVVSYCSQLMELSYARATQCPVEEQMKMPPFTYRAIFFCIMFHFLLSQNLLFRFLYINKKISFKQCFSKQISI